MSSRILVADDHEIIRHGVRLLLEAQPGWVVCDEARDGREVVEKTLRLEPDVVVLDIGMPELDGLGVTREIRRAGLKTEVLILTVHESAQLVHEIVNAGARGYVLKSDAGRELVNAVELLLQHRPAFSPSVSQLVMSDLLVAAPQVTPSSDGNVLTPREREVARWIALGHGNQEVATSLGISIKTVETHRANIMNKLGVHSSVALARWAIRAGIVEA